MKGVSSQVTQRIDRKAVKKRDSHKIGLAPGTLVHLGEQKMEQVRLRLFEYTRHQLRYLEPDTVAECLKPEYPDSVTWLNVDGLHDLEMIQELGHVFQIHPLLLEDIVHTRQRPRFEDHDDDISIVMRMLIRDENGAIRNEQLTLIIGPRRLVTFQEQTGDLFNPIRERLRNERSRIRGLGSDYLAYALLDMVVDHYFIIREQLSDEVDALEEEILLTPHLDHIHQIHEKRRQLITLRRAVWPLWELIRELSESDSKLIRESTHPYLRDLQDHVLQVLDTLDALREVLNGLLDSYMSLASYRMNEVMKVLTVIATIFIPLTFITGVYGMNFRWMPELQYRWSYPLVWLVMLVILLGMLRYFRKKNWF